MCECCAVFGGSTGVMLNAYLNAQLDLFSSNGKTASVNVSDVSLNLTSFSFRLCCQGKIMNPCAEPRPGLLLRHCQACVALSACVHVLLA